MQNGGLKRGRTIVAERERTETESERQQLWEKERSRKRLTVAIFVTVLVLVGLAVVFVMRQVVNVTTQNGETEGPKYAPTVNIVDESGSGYVTERMKEYVGMLEADLRDLGVKMTRAVVPAGKTREVDVYLEGRDEYYKCNLDRGTGVTAEDVVRMREYLVANGLTPGYVDVRVEGKAYYK